MSPAAGPRPGSLAAPAARAVGTAAVAPSAGPTSCGASGVCGTVVNVWTGRVLPAESVAVTVKRCWPVGRSSVLSVVPSSTVLSSSDRRDDRALVAVVGDHGVEREAPLDLAPSAGDRSLTTGAPLSTVTVVVECAAPAGPSETRVTSGDRRERLGVQDVARGQACSTSPADAPEGCVKVTPRSGMVSPTDDRGVRLRRDPDAQCRRPARVARCARRTGPCSSRAAGGVHPVKIVIVLSPGRELTRDVDRVAVQNCVPCRRRG